MGIPASDKGLTAVSTIRSDAVPGREIFTVSQEATKGKSGGPSGLSTLSKEPPFSFPGSPRLIMKQTNL